MPCKLYEIIDRPPSLRIGHVTHDSESFEYKFQCSLTLHDFRIECMIPFGNLVTGVAVIWFGVCHSIETYTLSLKEEGKKTYGFLVAVHCSFTMTELKLYEGCGTKCFKNTIFHIVIRLWYTLHTKGSSSFFSVRNSVERPFLNSDCGNSS